jgi:hypothetical protein
MAGREIKDKIVLVTPKFITFKSKDEMTDKETYTIYTFRIKCLKMIKSLKDSDTGELVGFKFSFKESYNFTVSSEDYDLFKQIAMEKIVTSADCDYPPMERKDWTIEDYKKLIKK